MTKILIVEDQTMLRESLSSLINEQTDMEVIGGTGDASKALELCQELNPDLVIMDVVTENGANGISFAGEIRAKLPEIKIVVMTGYPEITFIEEARKARVHSYLYKNASKEHLFYIIRSTMNGSGLYPGPADVSPFTDKFNEKEIAVIRLVCEGKSRADMLTALDMSESQLKQIITLILNKTGFDNIAQFAIYAVGRGLIVTEGKNT